MIQRLKDWFHHDDQEFLRLELRKAARWLRRPLGLFFVLMIFAASLLQVVDPSLLISTFQNRGMQASEFVRYITALRFVKPALFLVLLVYLIQRFTIKPFQNEHLIDLRLTLLSGREMWPAYLAAPLLLIGLQSALSALASYSMLIFTAIRKTGLFDISNNILPDGMMFYVFLAPLISAVSSFMLYAAMTAFSVQGSLRKGGSMIHLLLWMLLGYVMMLGARHMVFSILMVYYSAYVYSDENGSASFIIYYSVLIPLLNTLIAFLLFYWSLRRLRSGAFWKGLLASQEIRG